MYINQVQINKLKKELAELKEDYAEMIVKSYKVVPPKVEPCFYCPLKTFAGYKRAQYMKQYTGYRKCKVRNKSQIR
jgi:hypothetical protein